LTTSARPQVEFSARPPPLPPNDSDYGLSGSVHGIEGFEQHLETKVIGY
jgi:hypothetical protein